MSELEAFLWIFFWGTIWIWCDEKLRWNWGRHRKCHGRWQLFDVDSQGGHGYKCDRCEQTWWFSWPLIRGKSQ
jgi:hypothetical protein